MGISRKLCRIIAWIAATLLICALPSPSDKWPLPQMKRFYSPNRQYLFRVDPRKLEGQLEYFEDKAAGRENPGAVKGVKDNYCKGTLFKLDPNGKQTLLWSRRLENEVAPVSGLVADSGQFVVTFDNWHSMGYGNDVVVIYGADGVMIKKFALEDILSQEELQRLDRSVSSRRWGSGHRIEGDKILVLRVTLNNMAFVDTKTSTIDPLPAGVREKRIDLRTGNLLSPENSR